MSQKFEVSQVGWAKWMSQKFEVSQVAMFTAAKIEVKGNSLGIRNPGL